MRSNTNLGPVDFAGLTFTGLKQTNKHPNKSIIYRFFLIKGCIAPDRNPRYGRWYCVMKIKTGP